MAAFKILIIKYFYNYFVRRKQSVCVHVCMRGHICVREYLNPLP